MASAETAQGNAVDIEALHKVLLKAEKKKARVDKKAKVAAAEVKAAESEIFRALETAAETMGVTPKLVTKDGRHYGITESWQYACDDPMALANAVARAGHLEWFGQVKFGEIKKHEAGGEKIPSGIKRLLGRREYRKLSKRAGKA